MKWLCLQLGWNSLWEAPRTAPISGVCVPGFWKSQFSPTTAALPVQLFGIFSVPIPEGFMTFHCLRGNVEWQTHSLCFPFLKTNITWAFQCIVTSILNFVWVWFWWTGKDYFFSCIAIFNKVFSLQWQFSNSCNTGSCVLSVLLCKHNLALKSPPVLSSWQKLFSSHSFHYF